MITHHVLICCASREIQTSRDVLHYQKQQRNDVIQMFNNYAKLSCVRYSMIDTYEYDHAIIELMIEQRFATCFDDIYTMHIYRDSKFNYKYVVDVAFELHTNKFERDDNDDEYEIIHTYDMRVNVDISSNEIDYDEICNTIDFVEFKIIHRNAYVTREYRTTYAY
jgi:hypothetical protein